MLNSPAWSANPQFSRPQYQKLVQFLIEPLLDNPTEMKIDCEQVNENRRVWVRLSFDDLDKGRVYGRGGRNLQAIRTVVETAAAMAGQSIYLDIHNDLGMEDHSFSSSPSSSSYRGKFVRKNTEKRRSRPRGSSSYYRNNNEQTF